MEEFDNELNGSGGVDTSESDARLKSDAETETKDSADGAVAIHDGNDESVDDILAEIMGDGGFNDDFSGLYARYLGNGKTPDTVRRDNGVKQRVEYEAPPEFNDGRSAKKSGFEEKLPEGMRIVYDAAEEEAKRPEFTSGGEVRYPTMGTGEAEERVVFDASWEEQAKKEAAKREARRRDVALKGDSTYVRSFVSGGMPMANRGSTAEKRPAVNPKYIDPLSDDDPKPSAYRADSAEALKLYERQEEKVNNTENSDKQNSFFQDGFSVKSGNPAPADGKTYGDTLSRGASSAASEKSAAAPSAENGGKTLIDDAVLDAFARSQKSDEDFRAKWKNEIELAEKRKKERAAAQSRKKAEERAMSERLETEKKALADDLPGIPLEINGAEEVKRTERVRDNTSSTTPAEEEETFGFKYPSDGAFDMPAESELVEKITTGDIPEKTVMSASDRTVKKSFGEKLAFSFKTRFSAEGIKRWTNEVLPHKGDPAKEIVRKLVRIVSFLALLVEVIYLIVYFIRYEERKRIDDSIGKEIEQTLPSDEVDNAWANIKAKYPNVEFPEGMNINFANTYAINSDVVGYLRIAGEKTNIGTILLQKNGDDTYYLYRDLYGKKSRYGNPYVKSSSSMSRGGLSQNTIIYGHNTHDGLMFHELENYMTRDGYIDAPIVTLDTLFEQTKWKIFAVILTNSTPEADNGYVFSYLYSNFNSSSHYRSVLDGILQRSMIHTGVDVSTDDKILTLYTCYQSIFDGGRLVVFARQLRDGETEEINTSKVYYNSGARFPQAYYDAKKMTNPFASKTDDRTSPTPSPAPTTRPTEENVSESVTRGEEPTTSGSSDESAPVTASPDTTESQTAKPTEAGTAAA